MSRRARTQIMLGAAACVIALVPACAQLRPASGSPVDSVAPLAGGTTYTVGTLAELVAADGQAWMLTQDNGDLVLSRVGVDGRSSRVMSVPGQSLRMAPYREGVVLLSVACADRGCDETVSKVVLLDGDGSTLSEHELSREPGPLEDSDSVSLLGLRDDRLWAAAGGEIISYDLETGATSSRGPRSGQVTCLLDGGLYNLTSLSGPPGSRGDGQEPFDEPYEVVVEQLMDGIWVPLDDTRRTLTELELGLSECVAGSLRTGPSDDPSPAWSPATGWFEADPYTAPVDRGAGELPFITKVARGQADQLFTLERDGLITRLFAAPGAPLTVGTIDVPAEIFMHDREGPPPGLSFDMSSTTMVGCVSQTSLESDSGPSRCYITSK